MGAWIKIGKISLFSSTKNQNFRTWRAFGRWCSRTMCSKCCSGTFINPAWQLWTNCATTSASISSDSHLQGFIKLLFYIAYENTKFCWYYHIAINTTHYELLVKADGSWQVLGQTQCECSPGYIPSLKTGLCTGLLMDLFWHFTKRFTWTKWKLSHIPLSHFVMNIMIMNFHISRN